MDDIEAIKQVKARYARSVDLKDWDGFRQVWADDAVWDTRSTGAELVTGADAIVEYVRRALGDVLCIHHAHLPEIALTSPTTATGIWMSEHMHRWPDGMELHGYGIYRETYEKVDGTWRMKTCVYDDLRADFTHPT